MDIAIKNLEHRYNIRSPFERLAIYDISLEIKEGSYTSVIGHTGSGKSTFLQHLNGLLKPTKGSVTIGDRTITAGEKQKHLKSLRKKVGIVFQFPEHQLFEETIEKDIAFGPINFGVPKEEAVKKAHAALEQVGLSKELLDRSPFDLSGGQMRRVAIAGVLAMEPEVLVLDEPTAGLDPHGRKEIMDMFYRLHKEQQLTTILVTHSMEDAAKYADDIVVLEKGTVRLKGKPEEIFAESETLVSIGLDLPETIKFQRLLEKRLGRSLKELPLTMEGTVDLIKRLYEEGAEHQ